MLRAILVIWRSRCALALRPTRSAIGIDISEKAAELAGSMSFLLFKPIHRWDIPQDRSVEKYQTHTLWYAGREV